jgi:hypothetical protein
MPRPVRRGKSRRAGYDDLDIEFLLRGPHGVPCELTSAEEAGDNETIREAWESMRSTLLPQWIRELPGTRPWAWWTYDAANYEDGRRRRIDGKPHPFDNKERSLAVAKSDNGQFWRKAYALSWGLPATFIPPHDIDLHEDFMRNKLNGRESEIFEPEWSFITRHNLLLPEDSP